MLIRELVALQNLINGWRNKANFYINIKTGRYKSGKGKVYDDCADTLEEFIKSLSPVRKEK